MQWRTFIGWISLLGGGVKWICLLELGEPEGEEEEEEEASRVVADAIKAWE